MSGHEKSSMLQYSGYHSDHNVKMLLVKTVVVRRQQKPLTKQKMKVNYKS